MPTLTDVTDADLELIGRAFKGPKTSDVPFTPPIECTFDIPVPPSVNKIRRIDWNNHKAHKEWRKQAGFHLLENGQFRKRLQAVERYELTIILDEAQTKIDPDNIKAISDFLKSINVIVDDAPKHARQILIKWGEAPAGCRLIVKPIEAGRDAA